jgi:hypothetical protein
MMNEECGTKRHRLLSFCVVHSAFIILFFASPAFSQTPQRFPPPDFRSGYRFPQSQLVLPHGPWRNWVDAGLFATCLAIAAWLAVKKRSRNELFWLTVFCA